MTNQLFLKCDVTREKYFPSPQLLLLQPVLRNNKYSRGRQYRHWATKQDVKQKEVKKEKPVEKPVQQKAQNPADENKSREKKKLGSRLKQLEEKIDKLKKQKAEGEQKLSTPSVYGDQKLFSETLSAFNSVASQLETANKEWETVYEELEKIN